MSNSNMDKVLKEGKDWISKKENQEAAKKVGTSIWGIIKGWFSKKK